MIKNWFSHPLLIGLITLSWLALQAQTTLTQVFTGLFIGLLLSRFWVQLDPPKIKPKQLGVLLKLIARVAWDIVVSNYNVALLIIRRRPCQSQFVHIPLQLTQPAGLAALACIITATPGTIWVSHDTHHRQLLIHVLDLQDKAALIRHIKHYYEQPLKHIFQS